MYEREASGIAFVATEWPLRPSRSTLIFIHGAGSSSTYWNNHLAGLADRANTLAVDLPGRGRSAGPGKEKVEDYARAMETFLDELTPPRPIPVGFSMGGAVVQQLLVERPEAYAAAILIATGAKLRVMPAIFELIENDFETYIAQVGKTAASPKTDPELLRPVIEDRARCDPKVVLGDFRACDTFDIRERLAEIRVPVLVITAEEDILTPPRFGAFLTERLADSRRVHLEDAGHFVAVEQSAKVNNAIRSFMDQQAL